MTTKRKIIIFLLTISLMALPHLAFAASTQTEMDKQIQSLFTTLNIILLFLQAFLWPILLLMGSLLSNDFLFSGGMQTMLLNIWSTVRDFVNIIFVLGLLAVAISNILGVADQKMSPKTVIPKIAIALIVVNFSFLACKVVLDAVNVASTAIFAMPIASANLAKYQDPAEAQKLGDKICERMMKLSSKNNDTASTQVGLMDFKDNPFCEEAAKSNTSTTQSTQGKSNDSTATAIKYKLKDAGLAFFSAFNSRNAALVMAVELMDITNLDSVKADGIKSLKELSINTLFSIVFFIIYATAFFALFVTLLVRVVVLWISIAVSPLSALGFAFEGVKSALKDNDPFKLFLDHALIPLYVAPILTLGMAMITQLKQISPNSVIGTNLSDLGTLTSSMTTLQDLIAGFATAIFIWTATFAALQRGKAASFVKAIQGKVEGFAKSAAKMPLYAPILPVYGKDGKPAGNVGVAALAGLGNGPEEFNRKQQKAIDMLNQDEEALAKSAITEAKNAKDLKAAMAKNPSAYRYNDAASGKSIVKQLKQYDMVKTLKGPTALNHAGGVAGFLKDLEAGKITEADYKQFLAENDMSLDRADLTDAEKAAKDLDTKARRNNVISNSQEFKDFTAAKKAFESKKDADTLKALKNASTALEQAITQQEALQEVKITSAITANPTDADLVTLHRAYEAAKTKSGGKDLKEALIQKIHAANPGITAADLADRIISGPQQPPAVQPVTGASSSQSAPSTTTTGTVPPSPQPAVQPAGAQTPPVAPGQPPSTGTGTNPP